MATKAKFSNTAPERNRRWSEYVAVSAILAWYYVSAVAAVASKSTTFDEPFHLTGGYSYWTLGDFRIQPENGNLPQRWAAIPLLFGDVRFPDLNQDIWRQSNMAGMGQQFFYELGNGADAILLRGRDMMGLFGVALGALIFFWVRSLLGSGPALVSLTLFAFCPTILANGVLVTSDIGAALFFTASMLCIWRVLHQINWRTLLIGSLVMGCLFVAKFSAAMIVPMGLILMTIQLSSRRPIQVTVGDKTWNVQPRRWRLLLHLGSIGFHAVVVWATIWAFYNFRFEMFAATTSQVNSSGVMEITDKSNPPWSVLTDKPTAVMRIVAWAKDRHLLPEAYLFGFAHTWRFAQARSSFLNGKYSIHGWRHFFPYCLMVKTPLTLFVLMALSLAFCVRCWYRAGDSWRMRWLSMLASLYRTAPLWVLWIVYWSFAIPSHLNIGHRHILPTYPPMLAFAGGAWLWLAKRRHVGRTASDSVPHRQCVFRAIRAFESLRWPIPACIVVISIVSFCAESLLRWPNYLAYFNQVVGGPRHGYRHLVDSSLDWGQDLPALQRWLAQQGNNATNEKTYLAYFGTGTPSYYGINATLLSRFFYPNPPDMPEPFESGTYCISATMLQNVYTIYPGRWRREYERIYQELASLVRDYQIRSPIGRNRLIAEHGEQFWLDAFAHYEHARLARLTSFLRQREPDDNVNYSILIYRVNADELERALDGPPVELYDGPRNNN